MSNSTGLITGSVIYFALVFIIGVPLSLYVKKHTKDRSQAKENFSLTWSLVVIGVIMMWLLWFCAYLHQMNPLVTPKLD
ncbi:unnamed protein product [Blepharisma stoltei]|uniref:Uncharacterized protein n=1 Tax=Blepharisma stoltei TaxID=1481888 RepID=A0AAU9K9F8_9CILI|nr:unnamed protein product [Blepharisma stoltei]